MNHLLHFYLKCQCQVWQPYLTWLYIENMATIHKVKLNIFTAYGFTLSSLIAMTFPQIHEFKQ